MSPYRGGGESAAEVLEDRGIVDDLVRQFADPFAFQRELIQNAIDAGATAIQVRFVQEGSVVIASVRDDGEGMDLATLETRLLVLFRSGKEGMEGKIGKFGVGFASVFALDPERVTVTTSRGTGEVWTMQLARDHSYEIFEAPGGTTSGTTVSLRIPLHGDFAHLAETAVASLRRWCRHAMTPIHLTVVGEGYEEAGRIDTPMVLEEALVSVHEEVDGTSIVVGLRASGSYAGFFNHGLTLHENHEGIEPLMGLAFKVRDSRLEHTLSRDDVRRDAHYGTVLMRVERLARRALGPAVIQALEDAASNPSANYERLVNRAIDEHEVLALRPHDLPLRLLESRDGRGTCTPRQAGSKVVYESEPSPLTAALAANGVTVFHEPGGVFGLGFLALTKRARAVYTAVLHQEASPIESAMFDRMLVMFDQIARRPSGIRWVELHGRAQGPYLGGPLSPEPLVTLDDLDANPFRLVRRPALLLDAADAVVCAARLRCADDAQLAAAILARAVLEHFGHLDANADLAWALAALESVEG